MKCAKRVKKMILRDIVYNLIIDIQFLIHKGLYDKAKVLFAILVLVCVRLS